MAVAGIIAEYNPFHEGHLHLVRKIKEELGQQTPIVVIMSGCFVQRGEPAILDRAGRVSAILQSGVDIVLELPFTFACASADRFASGSVSSLLATGVVTDLFFGAEHGSIEDLQKIADIDFESDPLFTGTLSSAQKDGDPYAVAWEKAAKAVLLQKDPSLSPEEFSSIIGKPNNTLAISYLREIKKSGSSITPHLVLRQGDYRSESLEAGDAPSATAIRKRILSRYLQDDKGAFIRSLSDLSAYIPEAQLSEMLAQWNQATRPMGPSDLVCDVFPMLRAGSIEALSSYAYMGQQLASHLKNTVRTLHFDPEQSLEENFRDRADTRCFPQTRIMRALSSLVIGQTESDIGKLKEPKYLRLLGFSEHGRAVLKAMREVAVLPILSRASDAFHHAKDPLFFRMDELDRISHDWWTLHARSTWEEDFKTEVIQFKRNKIYRR